MAFFAGTAAVLTVCKRLTVVSPTHISYSLIDTIIGCKERCRSILSGFVLSIHYENKVAMYTF